MRLNVYLSAEIRSWIKLADLRKQYLLETVNAAAVFEEVLVEISLKDSRIVFISTDSFIGAGASGFKKTFPDRFFEFGFSDSNNDKIYVDGSYPSFIRCLKMLIGERSDYKTVIEQVKKMEFGRTR